MASTKGKKSANTKTWKDLHTTTDRILFRDFGDANGDLVLALGYRLFINGVDVTNHILAGSISFSYEPRGSENQLSFVLDNNNGKFELRPTNLGLDPKQYRTGAASGSAAQAFADSDSYATSEPWVITKMAPTGKATYIASRQAHAHGLTTFAENEKKELYLGKLRQRADIMESSTAADSVRLQSHTNKDTGCLSHTANEDISLYEGLFNTKSSVININDQVRLFIPDVNRDTPIRSETLWMCAFTGFVISAPPEHDFTSGQSTISISCSDIRTQLKRKRILVNATSADQITPNIGLNSGLFADIKAANDNTTNAFADASFTFEKLMAFVLTGHRLEGESKLRQLCLKWDESVVAPSSSYSMAQASQAVDNKQGFGQIWFGNYFEYDIKQFGGTSAKAVEARAAFLNEWNRLCVFGPTKKYLTWDGMVAMGSGTVRGGSFDALKVLVHFLVPTDGGNVTNLLDRTFLDQMGVQREYMSVQEIIDQVCERIDYCVTVTGAGDIVFEFPMYDFQPADMGKEFRAVYAVSDSVKQHTLNDEANSNPVTGLRVVGGYTDNTTSSGPAEEKVQSLLFTAYIVHELLAYRYGPIIEDYSIPFITNGPNTTTPDQEQYRRQLIIFGIIEFLKRLSEMSSMTIDSIYNPFARPNRPYYYNYGRRLGVTEGVQNTLSLFSNAATTVSTRYIRRVDDLTGDFISFTGSKSVPLKYSDKNALDVWTDKVEYEKFLQLLYDSAGINVLKPDNVPTIGKDGKIVAGAGGLTSESNKRGKKHSEEYYICQWGEAEKKALQELADKFGAKREDLLAVMAYESGLNHEASNTWTGLDGKGKPTYAAGFNQIMPVTLYGILKASDWWINKYPRAAELMDMRFFRYSKKNGQTTMYANQSLKPEFFRIRQEIFGTPAAQLDLYSAFLDTARSNKSIKFDSLEKLTSAQMGGRNGKNVVYDAQAQNMNGGTKDTNQYAAQIRDRFSSRARVWVATLDDGGCKPAPPPPAPPQPTAPVTVGGAGVSAGDTMSRITGVNNGVKNPDPNGPNTQSIMFKKK
jgi:hypothetical protein